LIYGLFWRSGMNLSETLSHEWHTQLSHWRLTHVPGRRVAAQGGLRHVRRQLLMCLLGANCFCVPQQKPHLSSPPWFLACSPRRRSLPKHPPRTGHALGEKWKVHGLSLLWLSRGTNDFAPRKCVLYSESLYSRRISNGVGFQNFFAHLMNSELYSTPSQAHKRKNRTHIQKVFVSRPKNPLFGTAPNKNFANSVARCHAVRCHARGPKPVRRFNSGDWGRSCCLLPEWLLSIFRLRGDRPRPRWKSWSGGASPRSPRKSDPYP